MGQRGRNARPVKPRRIADFDVPTRDLTAPTRAGRVIEWIETLHITSGMHAGRRFILRDWQRDIINDVYRTDADDRRIVRRALITMGRKNGKTQLAAALALCHLCGPEAEARGQVYSAAADRNQAGIIFQEMKAFILDDEELRSRVIIRDTPKELEDVETGSVYKALSSDARKAHGLSPSFYVCDELAQWPNRNLYDALSTGTSARLEPLGITISTQSADPLHVMSELVHYGRQVRDGVIDDPRFSAHIFSAPEGSDPWSEDTWRLANPALGDFRSLDEMRDTAQTAQRIPSQETAFRNFYLNQPIEADTRLIAPSDWDALGAPFDVASLRGARCIAGLDLSSTNDLTAIALYFPGSGHALVWGFLPDEQLERRADGDRAPYRQWLQAGHIITTPGRAIDKAFVAAKLAELTQSYSVEAVAYDRYRIEELRIILDNEGISLPLVEHGQGFKDMAPAVDEFERAVLSGKLQHGGNPLLRWAVSNVAVVADPAGNRKLDKARSRGRIDPLTALVMAIGQAAKQPDAPDFRFTGMVIAAE